MRVFLRSFLAVFVFLLCLPSFADTRYKVIDLGVFPDGKWEYIPTRIYNDHKILGIAFNVSNSGNLPYSRAFLWTPDSGYVDLPPPAGSYGPFAGGIGPNGKIVGSTFVYPIQQACTWDQSLSPSLFGPTPIYRSTANDIAADGSIYGDLDFVPTIFKTDGSLSFLPTPYPDFPFGQAGRLNQAGDILGIVYDPLSFSPIPVLWDQRHNPTIIDPRANAFDLNDRGWVVGSFVDAAYPFYANKGFIWSRNVGLTPLSGFGPPGPGQPEFTQAYGINNRGQIVGGSIPPYGFYTSAVIWENGQFKDLNTLIGPYNGWFLSAAYGISDQGEITGVGVFAVTNFGPFLVHGFLLKPI